jgi:glycosyltransferase involved in cell wall biosynthesis
LNLQKGKPVILLPGRLTEWKGHEYLLDALAYLSKDSFQCVLLGDDKHHAGYRTRLQKKIQAFELDDVVHIVQNVSDMPAVYSLVDIVVSASLRPEAFGRVAIEAQAMECLVVATNHGGSCETVIPEKTGWLVETDDAEAFAGMLKQALDLDKDKRNKMAQAARENVQNNFSLTQMTDKTLDVYSDVLTLRNDIA